jgi:hypothetical protein
MRKKTALKNALLHERIYREEDKWLNLLGDRSDN